MIIGKITQDQIALAIIALSQEEKMVDVAELVRAARSSYAPPYWGSEKLEPLTYVLADALEAQAAEITRLRAAINNALLEPWLDGQLNGTWRQEPIGQNETPEEAVKRLVSVRAEWAVYKNNCENPVIAELRAALATARREGMEGFDDLVAASYAEAARAMHKFPQPNYVISKIAEEAGEVVKAAIHCAEKRETAENVAREMRQLIAMIIRLWVEGDQVHGLPPIAAALVRAALTGGKDD